MLILPVLLLFRFELGLCTVNVESVHTVKVLDLQNDPGISERCHHTVHAQLHFWGKHQTYCTHGAPISDVL